MWISILLNFPPHSTMGKGDRDDEFGQKMDNIGLTTGKKESGMGKYAFGTW